MIAYTPTAFSSGTSTFIIEPIVLLDVNLLSLTSSLTCGIQLSPSPASTSYSYFVNDSSFTITVSISDFNSVCSPSSTCTYSAASLDTGSDLSIVYSSALSTISFSTSLTSRDGTMISLYHRAFITDLYNPCTYYYEVA